MKEYILNSFIDERYSNGYTEGINNKIKVIKREHLDIKVSNYIRKIKDLNFTRTVIFNRTKKDKKIRKKVCLKIKSIKPYFFPYIITNCDFLLYTRFY